MPLDAPVTTAVPFTAATLGNRGGPRLWLPRERRGGTRHRAASAFAAGRELAFATVDAQTGTIAGSTRFMNVEPAERRVEIGFTFLAASYQHTHVNTAAKLAMLGHAFDVWA